MTYDMRKVYEAMQDKLYSEMDRWAIVKFVIFHQGCIEKYHIDLLEIPLVVDKLLVVHPVLKKVFAKEHQNG